MGNNVVELVIDLKFYFEELDKCAAALPFLLEDLVHHNPDS